MIFVYYDPRRKLRRKFRLILPGFIYRWSRWVDVPVNQRGSLWIFSNQEIVTRLFSRSERRVPDDHANYRAGRSRRSHPYSPFSVFRKPFPLSTPFSSSLNLGRGMEKVWPEGTLFLGWKRAGTEGDKFLPRHIYGSRRRRIARMKKKSVNTYSPPPGHPSVTSTRSLRCWAAPRTSREIVIAKWNESLRSKERNGAMRTTGIIEKKLKFERESRKRRRKVRGMRERGGKRRWGWWRRRWRGGDEAWLKSPARQKTQIDQNESYAGQKKVNEQDGSHAFRASGEFSETRQ